MYIIKYTKGKDLHYINMHAQGVVKKITIRQKIYSEKTLSPTIILILQTGLVKFHLQQVKAAQKNNQFFEKTLNVSENQYDINHWKIKIYTHQSHPPCEQFPTPSHAFHPTKKHMHTS